jgi:hypothetical protein
MKNILAVALVLLFVVTSGFGAPETFTVERFTFAVPPGWKKVPPPSPMRKAQLEVGEDAAKAEVTFFHFGGGSGSVTDNVSRWFSQFPGSEATRKSETLEVSGVKITFVQAAGTFSSGMPGGPTTPMADYALRGAILENAETGDVYVKMTGPKETVQSATEAFQKMVKDAAQPAAR